MTTSLANVAPERAREPRLGVDFLSIARDVATLGTGTALAAIFGTLQVFVVPRILSVEDFGYWRLYLLYVGYLGVLHLGFADGALLRWAGRPLDDFRLEIWPALRFLFWQQAAIIVPGVLIAAFALPGSARFIAFSVLLFALLWNTSCVLQSALQATRKFAPVAAFAAAPTGIFLAAVLLWSLKTGLGFQALIIVYFLAWICGVIFLWTQVRPPLQDEGVQPWVLGKQFIAIGWPVVLANFSYGLIQTADRLVVSSVLPISQFALYSFAASAMFVPITAITAISRVFFSHAAAIDKENHAGLYQRASNLLFLAWSLLLPYYFVLDWFTRRFLPKYRSGVPVAGVLLFSVVFLAGIQILHSSFFNLYGFQRRFLRYSAGAVVMILAAVAAAAFHYRSLIAVAAAEVVVVGLWWQFNEHKLRAITGQSNGDWLRALSLLSWAGLSFWASVHFAYSLGLRVALFYVMAIPGLFVIYPRDTQMLLRFARHTGRDFTS
jgi:O-antigen/teichoic acid export membrane protein